MNPPSQPAPQTRAFQSWQLVFIAVMLLAAAVTSGLYIATVQAESHGSHNGPDADQRRARNPDGVLGRGQPHAHRLPGGLG